ncbi:MAG: hypothetical protein QM689_03910 [Oscillospiraceae bacterium]
MLLVITIAILAAALLADFFPNIRRFSRRETITYLAFFTVCAVVVTLYTFGIYTPVPSRFFNQAFGNIKL